MNKIKEFEWASTTVVGDYSCGEYHLDTEKFANLIIRECIDIIKELRNINSDVMSSKGYKHWGTYSGVLDDAENRIKQHFGIEQ